MSQSLVEQVRARRPLPPPRMARAIREAAGVSQTRLAQELGVDRMTVARWENGSRSPSAAHREPYGALLTALQEVTR